jgi:CRP/FNR family cyclic AMP-dependent transcriptional regulator
VESESAGSQLALDRGNASDDGREVSTGDGKTLLTRIKELPPVRALGRRAVVALNEREKTRPALAPRPAGAWALEHLRLLARVPEAEILALEQETQVESHARRHSRLLEDAGAHVWLVLRGGVKLCRVGVLGQRMVEALLEPGDVFGRVAGTGEPVTYEIQSLETSRIARVRRASFEALLRRHPDMAFAIVQTLEDRQRKLVRRIEGLVFKDVRARVAEALLDLVREHGDGCAHGFAVDVRITQQDLAELVGASRQMVNRVLGQLSRELYLHRTGRVICILQRERLERLAEQS